MKDWIEKALNVRYVKLHFELKILEDTIMPKNKVSALRGGMGEMLLRANCIKDRRCKTCDFVKECIVRRTMYSQFEKKPKFVTTGDSIGYVIECEDYREEFGAGSILKFNMIIFGKTIVYLNQIMQAFFMLGMEGIGKNHSKFTVSKVTNTRRKILMENGNIFKPMYEVSLISDYVSSRMENRKISRRMLMHTPAAIKYNGVVLDEFNAEAIFAAIERRLFMLDCFEEIETEKIDISEYVPKIIGQEVSHVSVRRYSSTHNEGIYLTGIRGIVDFDEIWEEAYKLLLAGELIHIGKNTSFGFGRYTMVER